jgi:hypothetical protein
MLGRYGLKSRDSGQGSVSGSSEHGKERSGARARFTIAGALEKSKFGGPLRVVTNFCYDISSFFLWFLFLVITKSTTNFW